MLDNVVKDRKFSKIMKNNIQSMIIHFFETQQHFGVLCNIDEVSFNPELPDSISSNFNPLTLFFLAGYTFETARIEGEYLVFEAGFGSDNFGSVVSLPLLSILQIIVDETPVLINLATYREDEVKEPQPIDSNGVENSMASFLSNPENSKFLKK